MKRTLQLVITLTLSSLFSMTLIAKESAPAAATHGAQKTGHGANLDLFAIPQANKAKGTSPNKTEILEPGYMAKVTSTTVALKWKEVAGATNYHVQVATDPNFKWLVADENFVKASSFTLTNVQKGQGYHWRVAVVNADNDASFTKSFFVKSYFQAE